MENTVPQTHNLSLIHNTLMQLAATRIKPNGDIRAYFYPASTYTKLRESRNLFRRGDDSPIDTAEEALKTIEETGSFIIAPGLRSNGGRVLIDLFQDDNRIDLYFDSLSATSIFEIQDAGARIHPQYAATIAIAIYNFLTDAGLPDHDAVMTFLTEHSVPVYKAADLKGITNLADRSEA